MGPKRNLRKHKRPKTTERPKEPPGSGPEPTEPTISARSGVFVPFSGAGHRLGEGCGPRSLPADRGRYSAKPAATYLLFQQHQSKRPSTQEPKNVKHVESGTQRTEFLEPVDRQMLVYHMDAKQSPCVSEEDPPEEFFQVTADDIKKRYAQLQTDRRALEEAPLLTSALREDHAIRRMQHYPQVVIRVCFPDRHVLQGVFRPLETVGNVMKFVRSHLTDPQLQFCLYGAPMGMRMEDFSATLYEANLFPNALLYFSSSSQTGGFLHPHYTTSMVSVAEADAAVKSCEPRSHTSSHTSLVPEGSFPLPAALEASTNQQRPAADSWRSQKSLSPPTRQHSDPPTGTLPRPVGTADHRIPKWLKLPGKK